MSILDGEVPSLLPCEYGSSGWCTTNRHGRCYFSQGPQIVGIRGLKSVVHPDHRWVCPCSCHASQGYESCPCKGSPVSRFQLSLVPSPVETSS